MPTTLSESESKRLLSEYSIPFAPEILAVDADSAAEGAESLGFPVAIKLCGEKIAHKTERGLVRLGISNGDEAREAAAALIAASVPEDGATGVLVSPMISGSREFIAGMNRDAQFGPTVVFGVGGVFTEVLDDAVVRLVPITALDANDMTRSIDNEALLGEFRGEPVVDRDALSQILLSLSRFAVDHPEVASVDLNPIIINNGAPIAVDALVELGEGSTAR